MILALFAVAPAADPKSLLGAIDVPCKMSGNLNFFNFENPIFKFQTFIKNYFPKATVNSIQNYLHFRLPAAIMHRSQA